MKLLLVIIQAFGVWTSVLAIPDSASEEQDADKLDGDAVIDVGHLLNNPLIKFIGTSLKNIEAIPDNITDEQNSGLINGDAVIDIGNSIESPLITFIGKAIKNLEGEMKTKLKEIFCRLPSCLEWSDWTECIHKIDSYGIQNRKRICGQLQADVSCISSKTVENETHFESRLCEIQAQNDLKERNCTNDYTKTEHGFCVKLYHMYEGWYDAQSYCERDGGNLINIDSKEKSQDVAKTFSELVRGTVVLMDGTRNSSNSDWEVKSGTESSFSNWQAGEPNSYQFPACRYGKIIQMGEEWKWYDHYPCTHNGIFVCEIR